MPLRKAQVHYAALDACILIPLYEKIQNSGRVYDDGKTIISWKEYQRDYKEDAERKQNKPAKTCNFCKKEGHQVAKCPLNAGKPKCKECGRFGHTTDKC